MAVKTFYLKDAIPTGATAHRSLQDGGSAPTAATTGTGWVADSKAIGQSCQMEGGVEVSRTDNAWGTTLQPSSAPSSVGDCWRSENLIAGSFAATQWTLTFGVRSVTAAYAGRFRLGVRLWKSSNADGTGATEITSGRTTTPATSANLTTTSDTTLTWTWTPGSPVSLNNEYLFVQVGVEVTSAGSGNTQDIDFRVGSTYTLVTSDFSSSIVLTLTGQALPIVAGNLTPYTPDVMLTLAGQALPIVAGNLSPVITYAYKKLYFVDSVAPGATAHRTLQIDGTPPSNSATATGWTVGTNLANQYHLMVGGSEVAMGDAGWTGTALPSGAAPSSIGDAWRTDSKLTGSFENATWQINFGMLSVAAADTGQVRLRYRIWRGSDPDGVGATELNPGLRQTAQTSAPMSTDVANPSASAGTWSPGGIITLNDEYLFVQVAVQIYTAGSAIDQDAHFATNPIYCYIKTSNFSVGGDITLTMTGQALPIVAGNLGDEMAFTLTGIALPIAAGTITYQVVTDITLTLNGQALPIVAGNLSKAVDVTLLGQTLPASPGLLTPQFARTLTGIVLPATPGALNVSLAVATAGSALPSVAGNLSPQHARTLTGQALGISSGLLSPAYSFALVGQSVPAVAGNLSTSFTFTLSGQVLTIVPGTIVYQVQGGGNITLTMTGTAMPIASGLLAPRVDVSVSGIALPASVGTMSPQFSSTLAGIAVPAVAGSLTPQVARTLAGIALPIAAGNVAPQIARTIVGQSVTIAAGALSPAATLALLGISLAINAGTLSPTAGNNITLTLTGQGLPIAAGLLSPQFALALTGQAASVVAGQLVYAITRVLQGQVLTITQGNLLAAHGISIVGQQMSINTGTLTPAITLELTGQFLATAAGQLLVQGLLKSNARFVVNANKQQTATKATARDQSAEASRDVTTSADPQNHVIIVPKHDKDIP